MHAWCTRCCTAHTYHAWQLVLSPAQWSTLQACALQDCSKIPVAGRNIILVEDIVDTGRTLQKLIGALKDRGVASVTTVTLLDKPERRTVTISADYTGFVCEDKFVVGCDANSLVQSFPWYSLPVGCLEHLCVASSW